MERNSICAVYKAERKDYGDRRPYYAVSLMEKVFNPFIKKPNKWCYTFYNCKIYTDIEIEGANFDLNKNKDKFSFDNISNPEHSIIRVLDFSTVRLPKYKNGKLFYGDYVETYTIKDWRFESEKPERAKRTISVESLEKRLENQKLLIQELRKENKALKAENKRITKISTAKTHYYNKQKERYNTKKIKVETEQKVKEQRKQDLSPIIGDTLTFDDI